MSGMRPADCRCAGGCPCHAKDPIPCGLSFMAADYRASWLLQHGARQRKCPRCGLYTIWTRPTRGTPPWEEASAGGGRPATG